MVRKRPDSVHAPHLALEQGGLYDVEIFVQIFNLQKQRRLFKRCFEEPQRFVPFFEFPPLKTQYKLNHHQNTKTSLFNRLGIQMK